MNSVLQPKDNHLPSAFQFLIPISDVYFDCKESETLKRSSLLSKTVVQLYPEKPQKVKLAPSETILKHCKELLDNHSLRKPSVWSNEPVLGDEDVKLLHHIIESNERYQCLKDEDSALLKEILVTQMSEVEAQQRILWQLLKILQNKRKNIITKRLKDLQSPKLLKTASDSVVPLKKERIEKRRQLSARAISETRNHRIRTNDVTLKKLNYEGYATRTDFVEYIPVSWKLLSVNCLSKEFDIKKLSYENVEGCTEFYEVESTTSSVEIIRTNLVELKAKPDCLVELFKTKVSCKLPPDTLGKIRKFLKKRNGGNVNESSGQNPDDFYDPKPLNQFGVKCGGRGDFDVETASKDICSRRFHSETIKSWILFFAYVLLFTLMVASLTVPDWICIN